MSLPVPIIALSLGSALPDAQATDWLPRTEHTAQHVCRRARRDRIVFSVTLGRMSFSKKWLPSRSHPLALPRQVIRRDDLDQDWKRRLDRQSTALLLDQPHRESRVGAQIVVQHHRDAAFAQQPSVVGIEVMGNKDTAHPT